MKNKRQERLILLIIVILMIIFVCITVFNKNSYKSSVKVYHVSYIGRMSSVEESQYALKLGMNQASKDYNVEIRSVSYEESITREELISLIKKEIKNGAQGILLENLLNMEEDELKQFSKEVPIVSIDNSIGSEEEISHISADYEHLGKRLANIVSKQYSGSKVYIVTQNRNFPDNYYVTKGIRERLEEEKIDLIIMNYTWNQKMTEIEYLMRSESKERSVIIAVGVNPLEDIAKMKRDKGRDVDVSLMGYGKSNPIISYIEEGVVDYVGMVDEYGMGYLGIENVISKINRKATENHTVRNVIINKDNIYTKDYQRLLFPFAQ